MAGRLVFPTLGPYCMSKFAVRAFGDSLRREMRPFDIHVSVVEPMMYRTPLSDPEANFSAVRRRWREMPDEVRDTYSKEDFKRYHSLGISILEGARKNINEVLNCFMDAIECRTPGPRDFYRPGGIVECIGFEFLQWMPEFIQDRLLDGPLFIAFRKLYRQRIVRDDELNGDDESNGHAI